MDDELRRRKYPRVRESCNVKFRVVDDPVLQPEDQGGVAVNISGGGMCFQSERELQPGAMVAVQMTLTQLPTPVVSLGKVVWCEPGQAGSNFDIGVEFWWIGWADQEAQSQMLHYVNEKLEELGVDPSGEST
jgi:Tfp pilus assembly protein PilZ